MREVGVYFLMAALILIGTVGLVFADNPPTPADSASQVSQLASQVSAEAPAAASGTTAGSLSGMLMPMALMFLVFYFLVIRPQQKKTKEHDQLTKELKRGDDVITNSGILGKITGVTDKVVTLEIAPNTRVKMLKSQVTRKLNTTDLSQNS